MRRRYLLCYDVRDKRRLRRTIKVAESFGHRLQYSVFICDLSSVERIHLERDLLRVIRADIDRALLVDLGQEAASRDRFRWVSTPQRLPASNEATIV
jgi:CRISPR-associated protein Cas2